MAPILRSRNKHDCLSEEKKKKRKKSKTNKENNERLMKKREQERLRRLKIKSDPIVYNKYLESEKARYKRRKQQGKIEFVNQLSDREKRCRRNKNKNAQRICRQRKKHAPISQNNLLNNAPIQSKQAIAGQKIAKRNIRRCYGLNDKLRNNNNILNLKIKTLEKKLHRLKVKKAPKVDNGPIHKVNLFLKNINATVPAKVKEQLVFSEVIKSQLKTSYNESTNTTYKRILKNALSGSIIKKYRVLDQVRKTMIPIPFKKTHFKQTKVRRLISQDINKFFLENSKIDPNKKSFIKMNGEKRQIQYLNASLIDLHKQFCLESNFKISYKTFTRYRPRFCIAPKITERNTCACFVHENFSLLVESLFANKIIKENTISKVINTIICNSRSEECFERTCSECQRNEIIFNSDIDLDKIVVLSKWVTEKEERLSEKTKKQITVTITKKIKQNLTVKELVFIFKESLRNIMVHEFKIIHQYRTIKTLKENLNEKECLILLDFSENYCCKYATEVQAVHFGANRTQITLHTGMIYTSKGSQGFGSLSPSLRHDASAVIAHVDKVLSHFILQNPSIKTIHFMSDSPTTQYRNRKMFYLITQLIPSTYIQIEKISYNFSETGHGKGPADGIGAVIKRTADDTIKHGQDLTNFDDVYNALKNKIKTIFIAPVKLSEIEKIDKLLPDDIKGFVGTMSIHQYTWSRENSQVVKFNYLSCFQCPLGFTCNHFDKGCINYDMPAEQNTVTENETISKISKSRTKVDSLKRQKSPTEKNESCEPKKMALASEIQNKNKIPTSERASRTRKLPTKFCGYEM